MHVKYLQLNLTRLNKHSAIYMSGATLILFSVEPRWNYEYFYFQSHETGVLNKYVCNNFALATSIT